MGAGVVDAGGGIAAGAANTIAVMAILRRELQGPRGNWHAAENGQNVSSVLSPRSFQVRRAVPVLVLVRVSIRGLSQILSQTQVQASRRRCRWPTRCSP